MSFRQCRWPHLSRVLASQCPQPRRERRDVRVGKDTQQNQNPLVRPGFWSLRMLGGAPPGFSAPSLTTQPLLGQINGTAGSWVFNWVFLMGRGGGWGRGGVGGFNEARSCFHPDLSASALQVSILWIKRKVWACRSTPEVSALTKLLCSVWHFHLNGIHPRPLHAEPGVPITTWCPLARWTRCSLMAVSAPQLVRGGQTWYLLLATMVKRAIVKSQSRFCKMTTAEF